MNLTIRFNDKIDAILSTIDDTETPYVLVREGANLDTFAVVSEDDVRKLVMKSKTTSCALDHMPAKLIKQYIAELVPLLKHIIHLWGIPSGMEDRICCVIA